METQNLVLTLMTIMAAQYIEDSNENEGGDILSSADLIFVNAVYRHGAKSPKVGSFPNDPNNRNFNEIWPNGGKQLTEIGMQMQYELGKFFRKRYSGFLDETYRRNEIYVRSTDTDRTLMSSQCNLAGLYPPNGKQKWNGLSVSWQPIPVHTVPLKQDALLKYPLRFGCSLYDKLLEDVRSSAEFTSFVEKHRDFMKEITSLAGFPPTENDVKLVKRTRNLSSTVHSNLIEGLPLPGWLNDKTVEKLKIISAFEYQSLFGDIGNEEHREQMAKVNGGILLKKIISNLQDKIEGESSYKMIQYSGHRKTMTALSAALGVSNDIPVPFASSFMFELYRGKPQSDNAGTHFVRILYKNETDSLIPLSVFGSHVMEFNHFVQHAQPVIPQSSDLVKICRQDPGQKTNNDVKREYFSFVDFDREHKR